MIGIFATLFTNSLFATRLEPFSSAWQAMLVPSDVPIVIGAVLVCGIMFLCALAEVLYWTLHERKGI